MKGVPSWGVYAIIPSDQTTFNLKHDRIYTCALSAGVSGGIIIAGLISIHNDWRVIYWVATALIGACTTLVIFTFPETIYLRHDSATSTAVPGESIKVDPESKGPEMIRVNESSTDRTVSVRHSYLTKLRIISGIYTQEPILKLFIRPVMLLILPPVLWATLVMAGTIGFLVAITSNFAPAFEQTYAFEPWQSGLCFIAALIGAFIGIFAGGHFSDWIADIQTQRNGGVREPEMRLPAILVSVITAPLALVLYGVGIHYKLHWICPTIGLGLSMSINPIFHLSFADLSSQLFYCTSHQCLACVYH